MGKSISKEAQSIDGSIFYCDMKSSTDRDARSISTTSLNSDECLLLRDDLDSQSNQSRSDKGRLELTSSASSAAFGSEPGSIFEDKSGLTSPDSDVGRGSWLM